MDSETTTTTSSPLSSVPSSPLSCLSRSPTPPSDDDGSLLFRASYPSPRSSQESSQNSTPCPDSMCSDSQQEGPPAKKRRVSAPNARSCDTLELGPETTLDGQQAQMEKLLKVLHKRRKIVVIAGAGISVSAGIPDFRSSTGLFKSLKSEHNLKSSGKDLFDASVYKDDASTEIFHTMVREMSQATRAAEATPFHHLLATLAQEGRLLRLYSQNIDGIDTGLPPLATHVPLRKVDGAWPKTVLLHGGLEKMVCVKCHAVSDFDATLFDGPVPPACPTCEQQDSVRTEHAGKRSHGIGCLRPRMVLYNEHNPDDEAIGSVTSADLRARPDALVVVGTTLKVPGVKRIAREMCKTVRDRKHGLAIWINNDPPPPGKEFEWDLVVEGPCDEVARHAAMRKWYEEESVELVTAEEAEKARQNQAHVVVISPSKKALGQTGGMLTPAASPKLAAPKAKSMAVKQELSTGSGTSATLAKSSMPKIQQLRKDGQPKAKPGPPKGWKKGGVVNVPTKKSKLLAGANTKINQAFKVSKAGAVPEVKPDVKSKLQPVGSLATKTAKPPISVAAQPQPQKPFNFTFSGIENVQGSTRWKPPSTPRKTYPFAPLSPTEARINGSPVSAAPSFSPLTGHRSKSLSEIEMLGTPTRAVKRRSSDSQETISPTGHVPSDMRRLLDYEPSWYHANLA